MKIGLNATCINDRPSGARQRFLGIYRELVKQMPDDEFVIFELADCRIGAWFGDAPNVSVRRTPMPSEGRARRFLCGLGYWRSALKGESLDVFEGFNLPLVTAPNARNVMTIHDLRGLRLADAAGLQKVAYAHTLNSALSRADQVVTVSDAVRRDLVAANPRAQVAVVYNGLDLAGWRQVDEVVLEHTRRVLSLPEEFLLAVGHFEPRKNYLRLIDATAMLRDRGTLKHLVIIGNDSGGKALVEARIRHHDLVRSVTLLSGLSDLEVRCAYKACRALVFPSTYEGFGIPILEAMVAGRPTILSDIPVFCEITENRAIYFPPNDVDAMSNAIEVMLNSEATRDRLVQYGLQRVKDFGFDSLATQVRALYRQNENAPKVFRSPGVIA